MCTPSRVSFLAGQYCLNHGYYGLSDPRVPGPPGNPALPSLFSELRHSGYKTGVIGKTHTPANWIEPHVDRLLDCAGFLAQDAYGAYLDERGLGADRDDRMLQEHFARYGERKGQGLDARVSRLRLEDSVEAWVAAEATRFIRDNRHEPWAAWVSFPRPHQVWTPAREFWDLYRDVELLPPSVDDPLIDKPPHQAKIRDQKVTNGDWYFEPEGPTAGLRRVLHGYYALVSQTDHFVGALLDCLEELDLVGESLVVYTADHGDFAGEHGFIEKAPGVGYDAITRVPYVWSWPGTLPASAVCDSLVEAVDFLPTVCRLLDLPAPTSVDGLDLSAALSGSRAPLRPFVVSENPWVKAVRTTQWKLVEYPRPLFPDIDHRVGELYNVAEDPWELTNRYHDASTSGVVEELRSQLYDWLVTTRRVRTAQPAAGGSWRAIRRSDDGHVSPLALHQMVAAGITDYL
ncbi:MAG: sulfatase-like hydrolase/transferase [Actinomycetota bacterium]|nr:sulfatase-like hydrolase/transferase [Actinomycetota bacterium]